MDHVVNLVSNKTATELSRLTHGKAYNEVNMREIIPFNKVINFIIPKDNFLIPSTLNEDIKKMMKIKV